MDLQPLSPPTHCCGWVSEREDKSTFYPRYIWVNSPRWRCKCGCEVHPEGWAAVPPRRSCSSPKSETLLAKQDARQQIIPPVSLMDDEFSNWSEYLFSINRRQRICCCEPKRLGQILGIKARLSLAQFRIFLFFYFLRSKVLNWTC